MNILFTKCAGRRTLLLALAGITLSSFLSGCWKPADADDFPGKYASNSEPSSLIEIKSDGTFTEWRDGRTSAGTWRSLRDDDCPNIYFRSVSGAKGGPFDPERTTCLERGYGGYQIAIDPDLGRYYTRK